MKYVVMSLMILSGGCWFGAGPYKDGTTQLTTFAATHNPDYKTEVSWCAQHAKKLYKSSRSEKFFDRVFAYSGIAATGAGTVFNAAALTFESGEKWNTRLSRWGPITIASGAAILLLRGVFDLDRKSRKNRSAAADIFRHATSIAGGTIDEQAAFQACVNVTKSVTVKTPQEKDLKAENTVLKLKVEHEQLKVEHEQLKVKFKKLVPKPLGKTEDKPKGETEDPS